MAASAIAHAVVVGTLLLVPLVRIELPPLPREPVRALLYDPPPPPPPPLPLGSGLGAAPRHTDRTRRETPRHEPILVAPIETPAPAPEEPASEADVAGGSPEGSPLGTPEGMEGGVVGGVVGGVPGGVIGGVVGGTGDIPVVEAPDRSPKLVLQVKPRYPNDAFVKKVEGTVMVEIVIDPQGRVARARVVRSVPELDEAALEAVRQWLFTPGLRAGRPVTTRAMAPVSFRIY